MKETFDAQFFPLSNFLTNDQKPEIGNHLKEISGFVDLDVLKNRTNERTIEISTGSKLGLSTHLQDHQPVGKVNLRDLRRLHHHQGLIKVGEKDVKDTIL